MNKRFLITGILLALLLACVGVFAADKFPAGGGRKKLLIVEVHADWCPRCHRVTPVFRELQQTYAQNKRVKFVVLDVTNKKSKIEATTQAEALGIGAWFGENKSKTSTVAIFNMPQRHVLHTFANQADKQVYVKAISDSLKK